MQFSDDDFILWLPYEKFPILAKMSSGWEIVGAAVKVVKKPCLLTSNHHFSIVTATSQVPRRLVYITADEQPR